MSWRCWSNTGCCWSRRGSDPECRAARCRRAISGSWWAHPSSHTIYAVINELAESPDVVRLRLVNGKITLVHRRVWPALVCVSDRFPPERLAAIAEEHTTSGAHRKIETPFPEWVPAEAVDAAALLSEADALNELPECLRS